MLFLLPTGLAIHAPQLNGFHPLNASDYLPCIYNALKKFTEHHGIMVTSPAACWRVFMLSPSLPILAWAGNFSLHHSVQNGSGAHPASYPMGIVGSFPGGRVART